MGRWSRRLAPLFVEFAGVREGDCVLDVGCGAGSLALEAARRARVVAIDPNPTYVASARRRPGGEGILWQVGDAQSLPYPDARFDACLSQLVIPLVPGPPRALAEMRRVTRPGGRVAGCVWDFGDGMLMIRLFWDAAVALDAAAAPLRHERRRPFTRRGEIGALWAAGGLLDVQETDLTIALDFASFDDYWSPFPANDGPAGEYVRSLPAPRHLALRERLRADLFGERPDGAFTLTARAWAARGTVPD